MKKITFLVIFVMTFCVSEMRAQSVDKDVDFVEVKNPIDSVDTENVEFSEISSKKEVPKPKADNYEDVSKLLKIFNTIAMENQQKTTDSYTNIFYPIEGKSKFMRRHHVTQRLEISVLGGNDGSEDNAQNTSQDIKAESNGNVRDQYYGKMNFGLNIGYSLVFIPGHIEDERLRINKFGFGYSVGLIAAFDKQDYYGETCDFLAKIGVETGNDHNMGIGFDFLVGTGKSCGNTYFMLNDEDASQAKQYDESFTNDWAEPYTAWCFKYGGQLWVRSNLLKTSMGNTDIRLFTRYVYSVNPHKTTDFSEFLLYGDWMEESWQFGLTFCYTF